MLCHFVQCTLVFGKDNQWTLVLGFCQEITLTFSQTDEFRTGISVYRTTTPITVNSQLYFLLQGNIFASVRDSLISTVRIFGGWDGGTAQLYAMLDLCIN
jgi:hypothetical protein